MIALPPPREAARCVLPPGRDVAGWYDALRAEIAAHLTPAHAATFARPVPGESGPGWAAQGERARRLGDLPPEDREALLRHLASVLSDIRRLAESGAAPPVRQAWPALREVPDLGCVHAVDGRPVLVAWGHAGGHPGVLARHDDGVAWCAPPRRPWAVWAVAAAAMLALGVFAGAFGPRLAGGLAPATIACAAPPGQLALLRDQAAEEARGDELRARLAQLAEELGQRRLQCPLPAPAVAAPTPTPVPAPVPPPPRQADLPEDAWRRRDVAVFEGCWHRYSNMAIRNLQTGQLRGVRSWQLCFDRQGNGRQTIVLEDGRRCENPLRVGFDDDDTVHIDEMGRCHFDSDSIGHLVSGETHCRRESDTEAQCGRRDLEGPNVGRVTPGRFRR